MAEPPTQSPAKSPTQSPAKSPTQSPVKSPTPEAPSPALSPALEQASENPAIEAASEAGEEDEFLSEGYETSSALSTSATSSIYAHTIEHGRRYQSFKNGRYPVPNDDMEQNREDMKHAMMLELTDGRLFYAPVENPQLIVDIGTGTGEESTYSPPLAGPSRV